MKIITPVLSQNVKNVKSAVNDMSGNHILNSQNGDAGQSKAQVCFLNYCVPPFTILCVSRKILMHQLRRVDLANQRNL